MDSHAALIRLTGIEFAYRGGEQVFRGLDFELKTGERVGLVGRNGSGKTTLLLLIEGLLRPTAGTVEIFGERRVSEKDFRSVRERVGFLFQDPDDQLFSPTVIEDVAFGPLNLGKSKSEALATARETLRILGLDGFEDRITYRLSHGEKKMVSLATVLAMKPEVLLFDEPVTGLDERTRARIMELLSNLPQPRVIVSHDREFLAGVTDRICRLESGRIEIA
jgi:cobalt/nickel transport system ATP-binding protein